MEKVRFGIVGIGNMGTGHVESIAGGHIENAVLTAVCDVKEDRLAFVTEKYGADIATYTDYKEMLASGKIDAVLIATPHYLHPVIAIEAFEAGLHVLSEKPIGVYTKKVMEMYEVAKAHPDQVFGIMYNQRTNPRYQKMREMLQGGELGELQRVVWIITNWYRTQSYYNSSAWRATWEGEGGGVLLNQCPHNLDLWQWICGMPKRVCGFLSFGKYHNIEVDDDATIYAEYANGATGLFITTTGEAPGTNRLEITGTKGKLVFENNKLIWTKLEEDVKEFTMNAETGFGTPKMTTEEIVIEEPSPEHRGILRNYTNAILNGTPLLAPGLEGVNGLSISNAAHLSAWKNNKWVDLPNDGEEFWEELQKKIAASNGKDESAVSGGVADLSSTYNSK
ncbi:MAG: Gfo/Idh/MocA family oxidoreductase [Ruminococcaceae bacterium]|nr:Gfo/Idh/MocA family oxidoreductase [Oscillospiraceae bacterium]